MSTNIRLAKNCEYCGTDFIAKTTVTKYCGDTCAKRAYKARKRNQKIEGAKKERKRSYPKPAEEHLEVIQEKHFLTVAEAAILLRVSKPTIYRLIKDGEINAVQFSERTTRIKRSEIDKLFNPPIK